jgi:hypothetical protein
MNRMTIALERGLAQRLKFALAKLEVEHGGRRLPTREAVERLVELELMAPAPFSFLIQPGAVAPSQEVSNENS